LDIAKETFLLYYLLCYSKNRLLLAEEAFIIEGSLVLINCVVKKLGVHESIVLRVEGHPSESARHWGVAHEELLLMWLT
jgi:hypothetical protein